MPWTPPLRHASRALLAGVPLAGLLAALPVSPALAGGSVLLIHPTRVILEGRTRGAIVTVLNRGDAAGTFVIDWVDHAMTPEGGLATPAAPAPWSLQPHVRYSPRRITLAPGESQVIRVALRPAHDVAEGEYWSHLRVVSVGTPGAASSRDDPPSLSRASSVTLVARPAMAIPVVWRHGRGRPEAALGLARVDRANGRLEVDVEGRGALSVRGALHVFGPAPRRGAAEELADPLPVVVYPNLARRRVTVSLTPAGRGEDALAGAELVYLAEEDASGRRTVLARLPLTGATP
jgi:P pilus assembly chaperone PapD